MKYIFIKTSVIFLFLLLTIRCVYSQNADNHYVRGKIIDKISRNSLPFATIQIVTLPDIGAVTDSAGYFLIENVAPGIYQFLVSSVGYKQLTTPEYIISTQNLFIDIEMDIDVGLLSEATIQSTPINRIKETPIGLQVVGLREIENSPGANRDISRIIRSYPGVSFSPVGYRNDLIVRGGAPYENRFFIDGIEIPNINHFSTQGASGGPVSILNADLIREVQFYTAAFPVNRSGALSSVMDIRLRDGNLENNSYKATLGASEIAFSANGSFSPKTTFLFSARQSYLQFLFKALELPFLPNYIDAQFKIKNKISPKEEIIFLGLVGIDNMKLNTDQKGEFAEYLLSYLPTIKQETFTLGASYRYFGEKNVRTLTVSYNYLHNNNLKYKDNDNSAEENLILKLDSKEQKMTIRMDNSVYFNNWTFLDGVEFYYADYYNNTRQKLYQQESDYLNYKTKMGLFGWAVFGSARYSSNSDRFTFLGAIRFDGCNFSDKTANIINHISPRLSMSYFITPTLSINASTGINNQLPPYTSLGYKDENGLFVNKSLDYMQVIESSLGLKWSSWKQWILTLEGFYKFYPDSPLSLIDGVPLACKGNDYGVIGTEPLIPTAEGRAYGLELTLRYQFTDKLNVLSSFTFYKSEYRADNDSPFIASAWDNRFIFNVNALYKLPRNWNVGAKVSAIGGAPYTPYDVTKSSLVAAWNTQGRPFLDYSLYNTKRLNPFFQLDFRVDKYYYFKKWMFGLYLDIQNLTSSKLYQPDVLVSTGLIENPTAPFSEQRYKMKNISQISGSLIPTIGIMVEF